MRSIRKSARIPVAIVMLLVLVSCASKDAVDRTAVGSTIGSVVGGILGNRTGSNDAMIAGSALGALIGASIAAELSSADQRRMAKATQEALDSGQSMSWYSPDSGASGSAAVVDSSERLQKHTVEVTEAVETVPRLKIVTGTFSATQNVRIRSGPDVEFRQLGIVAGNRRTEVLAKVVDKPWLLIGSQDIGEGYVHSDYLVRVDDLGDEKTSGSPNRVSQTDASNSRSVETDMERECRTVEQVIELENGKKETEQITACHSGDSWEIVET